MVFSVLKQQKCLSYTPENPCGKEASTSSAGMISEFTPLMRTWAKHSENSSSINSPVHHINYPFTASVLFLFLWSFLTPKTWTLWISTYFYLNICNPSLEKSRQVLQYFLSIITTTCNATNPNKKWECVQTGLPQHNFILTNKSGWKLSAHSSSIEV